MSTYSLTYDGYWRASKASGIPAKSGVYSVYACRYNASEKTVTLRKLIYIGESTNVRDRISGHERTRDWQRHLQSGEELCFNFAPIITDRVRGEAAVINGVYQALAHTGHQEEECVAALHMHGWNDDVSRFGKLELVLKHHKVEWRKDDVSLRRMLSL